MNLTDARKDFLVALPFGKIAYRVDCKTVFVMSVVGRIAGTDWITVVCKSNIIQSDLYCDLAVS